MKKIQTIDELNDAIRAQVEREMPRPLGGFDSADAEDEFRGRSDARFCLLVKETARDTYDPARAAARDAWAADRAAARDARGARAAWAADRAGK
jgi:hypothetical protein